MSQNLVYDNFIGVQQFNNTLYALRHISDGSGSNSIDYFYLCEYSLPNLRLTKDYVISTVINNQTRTNYVQFNHAYLTLFMIDNLGNFWFRSQMNVISSSMKYMISWSKVDISKLKISSSLQEDLHVNYNQFYENITIQSEIMGNYNLTTLSTSSNVYSYPITIQDNHYIEVVTGLVGYGYSNSFLGFRVSQITKNPSPIFNYSVLFGTFVISLIGIIINYRSYKEKKREMKTLGQDQNALNKQIS